MVNSREGSRRHQFEPDYAMPPGASLREAIQALGMTQSELSLRTGLSTKHVNQIIQGVAPITPETSLVLEKVTGVPARFWNSLEVNYRDRQARLQEKEITDEDRAWLSSLPIRELIKRGKLAPESNTAVLLQQVYRFFGVANRETWEKVWRAPLAAFRRSPTFRSDMPALATWLRLGELRAADIECKPFDSKKFRTSLQRIRSLTREHPRHFSRQLVELCAASGVAVVFISEIKGCRTSGAARFLSPTKALIQLSLRHKADDHFWFSFFHEAGHLLIHGKRETFVSDHGLDDLAEQEANRFSATALIPKAFEPELEGLQSASQIREFAEKVGIAPGVVVGRLQKQQIIRWNQCNHLKRGLEIVGDE